MKQILKKSEIKLEMLLYYFNNFKVLIEENEVNLIETLFITFTIVIVVLGSLMNFREFSLPTNIRQSFRYGKHCHKGISDPVVNFLEMPKCWFKHFYVIASLWAIISLFLIVSAIRKQDIVPDYILNFLDFVAGGAKHRHVQVDSNTVLLATSLLSLQCARRFYETSFVQIFSKHSKMNLIHYVVGHVHYFGSFAALLANTEGFVRGSKTSPLSMANLTGTQISCVAIFIFAWYQQYCANILLVNLRKNMETGVIKTEHHLMPIGGSFRFVSSPHMFFEIVMYCSLALFLGNSRTWWFIFSWVVSNQVSNAILTHQWYCNTFKKYPKHRRAIIPFLL